MTRAEKTELALIPVLTGLIALLADHLPSVMGLGNLFLTTSALLLFQGLIRDLWLLAKAKREPKPDTIQKIRCICVESTVGMSGIAVGIVLLGAGLDLPIIVASWNGCLLVALTLIMGFLMKDYVVEWMPFRLRKEASHTNIVFTWRR